jgi:hypothetical protein
VATERADGQLQARRGHRLPRQAGSLTGSITSRPLMPDVFWLGFGIALTSVLIGFVAGARSRSTGALTGLAIGAFLGVLAGFPLLVIGLSNA